MLVFNFLSLRQVRQILSHVVPFCVSALQMAPIGAHFVLPAHFCVQKYFNDADTFALLQSIVSGRGHVEERRLFACLVVSQSALLSLHVVLLG